MVAMAHAQYLPASSGLNPLSLPLPLPLYLLLQRRNKSLSAIGTATITATVIVTENSASTDVGRVGTSDIRAAKNNSVLVERLLH